MDMLSRLFAILLLVYVSCSVDALAFNKKDPLPPQKDTKSYSVKGYNDDAFGLVLLGSLFAGQDSTFASTFVGVSAIAATATNLGYFPSQEPRVPGAVAVVNLALSTLLKMTIFSIDNVDVDTVPSAELVEVKLTAASVVWSFTNWRISQQERAK